MDLLKLNHKKFDNFPRYTKSLLLPLVKKLALIEVLKGNKYTNIISVHLYDFYSIFFNLLPFMKIFG